MPCLAFPLLLLLLMPASSILLIVTNLQLQHHNCKLINQTQHQYHTGYLMD
jgi:hypothetical protein